MEPGDRVKVKTKDEEFSGILMPSRDSKTAVIKQDSGYNIGVDKQNIVKISILKKAKNPQTKKEVVKHKKGLPNITIISTGGTISSRVDYKTGAVRPSTSSSQLTGDIPELKKIANIKLIEVMNKLSEDIDSNDWKKLAKSAHSELNDDTVSGVVITHGTDTMHYTSAALSFMLRKLNKPVVLTGSQRSSDRGSSDAKMNLICSAHLATSNIAEVMICMHGSSDDVFCYAHRGTKARKMHTSRRDAFHSVNDDPIAKVFPDGKIELISGGKRRSDGKAILDSKLSPYADILYIHGNINPKILDWYSDNKYKGLVLMGTGMGHTPSKAFITSLKRAVRGGMSIFMTSQCLYGRVNSNVYSTARELGDAGIIYLGDMLPETALVKLMWVLGHSDDKGEVKKMMLENTAGELETRSKVDQNVFK